MAVRWVLAFAALVGLGVLLAAADYAGLVRLPWRPAPESGTQSSLLRATWTIDLETGQRGTPQADLHWVMAAPDQPYLRSLQGALIAEGRGARWEEMNASTLAQLSYSSNQYSAWGPEAPVSPGAVFGVRTAEGNLAKIRIAGIRENYDLRLEWVLYPSPAAGRVASADPSPDPSLAWFKLRDEALAAYKAQRHQEALDACGNAVAAAEKAGPASHALALATCGGLMNLHRRATRQMEAWLKQAVAIAMKLEQKAIVAALGPEEAFLKERCLRMLAVFYRYQNRPREAAENFALAVDTVRAMPAPETGAHRLALRSDLFDLGLVLAQLGYRETARRALGEARVYYLKTEPKHPTLKAIEAEERRLESKNGV